MWRNGRQVVCPPSEPSGQGKTSDQGHGPCCTIRVGTENNPAMSYLPYCLPCKFLSTCYVGEPDAVKIACPVRRGLGGNVQPQGCNAPPFHSMRSHIYVQAAISSLSKLCLVTAA